jgi:glycosyltransferase involved in cell wall biosynthesis
MNHRILAITAVDHPGGAEASLMRLLAGLGRRGWAVALTTPGGGPLRDAALAAGYEWHALPLGGLKRRTGARAIASWATASRLAWRADVVYLNSGVCGRLIPALALLRRRGRPRLVLHVHDMVKRVPSFWRKADVVLADSAAVARRLGDLHANVVYCPVDPDPPAAAAPWPTGTGPVVGFVGRLEPRKGPLDLVHAAPAIRRGCPDARIVVVGDDPYDGSPEYTRQVLASDQVEHHGWHANAPGLMRHLDVLVLPSYEEPFGTVLAEAMAVGTPVVATAVDGLPEVVRDGITGRLVRPGEPDELAAAVLEVLARRQEMGPAAREQARRFNTADYIDRVEALIS